MAEQSTIRYERTSPQVARITFANPPANLIVGETVVRLVEIVDELATDPDIQVVVFVSDVPDFFFNHFDLAAAADFPAPEGDDAVPVWTDLVLKLTKAPYITVASIRGRTRGGGNELALAFDLRYASLEKALFGQPEVGSGLLPGGGGTERLPRAIGRDRALEVILTSADFDAETAERWGWVTRALPEAELDAFVDTIVARLASFDRTSLATAKAMVNRAVLPPDADLVAAYNEFMHSLTLPGFLTPPQAQKLSSHKQESTSSIGSASTSASPTSRGSAALELVLAAWHATSTSSAGGMCRLKLKLRVFSKTRSCETERDAEAERGGGDPAIGIVLPLAERVTNLHAVGSGGARVGGDELVAGVDDFDSGDLGVELPQTRVAPSRAGALRSAGPPRSGTTRTRVGRR